MLRSTNSPWWRRLFAAEPAPAYVRAETLRRCPDCRAGYESGEHYCPRCHTATPEWRYG